MDTETQQPKPMSAAEYAEHAESVKSKRPTEMVTLKSGSVFELRRPNLQGYVITGRLPMSILMMAVKATQTDDHAAKGDAARDFPIFAAWVLRECCVNPKPDEIDMLPEDAWEIFIWAVGYRGVAGIDGLHSFRSGQEQRTAPVEPDGPELPHPAVATVADER